MISMDKKYKTTSGWPVVIYNIDGPKKKPIIAAVQIQYSSGRKEWEIISYRKDGTFDNSESHNHLTLQEIKQRVKK